MLWEPSSSWTPRTGMLESDDSDLSPPLLCSSINAGCPHRLGPVRALLAPRGEGGGRLFARLFFFGKSRRIEFRLMCIGLKEQYFQPPKLYFFVPFWKRYRLGGKRTVLLVGKNSSFSWKNSSFCGKEQFQKTRQKQQELYYIFMELFFFQYFCMKQFFFRFEKMNCSFSE